MPRLVCVSDTHGQHEALDVPDGDVLVFAGDACSAGTPGEWAAFCRGLGALPHARKVVVPGNHDWPPQPSVPAWDRARMLFDRGDHGRARDLFARSLGLRRAAGDRRGEGWMLCHLARAAAALGDPDQARDLADQALRVAREQGDHDLAEACRPFET